MSSESVHKMVPGELARFALLDAPSRYDDDLPACAKCGAVYHLREGHDPTRFCDACAHEMVDLLARALVPLTEYNPDLRTAVDRQYDRALDLAGGNMAKAGRLLGVSRSTGARHFNARRART